MPYHLAMAPYIIYYTHIFVKYASIFLSDSYGNRTRVTAVKGRCLNRLTKEPFFCFSEKLITVPSKPHTQNTETHEQLCRLLTSASVHSEAPTHKPSGLFRVLCSANDFGPSSSSGNSNISVCSRLPSPLSSLFGQALDRLVAVSSMHLCTSTSALSTSSSSRGLTPFGWDISS